MAESIVLFIFGLVLLIRGGDWFVDSACDVAHKFRMPEILIGATIVSIGTTLPEVMVSAQSAAIGQGGISYGNAIGSIICNTALIAAITIAIHPPKIERKTFVLPVVFFFIAAIIYLVAAYAFNRFSLIIGIILLAVFVIYMVLTVVSAVKSGKREKDLLNPVSAAPQEEQEEKTSGGVFALIRDIILLASALCCFILSFFNGMTIPNIVVGAFASVAYITLSVAGSIAKKKSGNTAAQAADSGKDKEKPSLGDKLLIVKSIVFLVIGAAVIALGANLLVDNGTLLAREIGVPESVIGLTFVAIGTSLPELVTAITSLIKKHGSLSLGNIIGANLFNLVFVSGVSIVISPFDVPSENMIGGIASSLVFELPVMLFVMMFLTLPAIIRGKLSRWQGISMLCIYAAFFAVQFAI